MFAIGCEVADVTVFSEGYHSQFLYFEHWFNDWYWNDVGSNILSGI